MAHATHDVDRPESVPDTAQATAGEDDDEPITGPIHDGLPLTVAGDGMLPENTENHVPIGDVVDLYVEGANRRHTPARRLAKGK